MLCDMNKGYLALQATLSSGQLCALFNSTVNSFLLVFFKRQKIPSFLLMQEKGC